MQIRDFIWNPKDIAPIDVLSILSHVLCMRKEQLYAYPEKEIDTETAAHIRELAEERKAGKPMAYIVGKKEFFSEDFLVNSSVLIPRPETEELVEEALGLLDNNKGMRSLMDMGTGSGIIGILLAKHHKGVLVDCVDCSRSALVVARENAIRHGVEKQVRFFCSDLFSAVRESKKYDLIVANLPYISTEEWANLARDVRDFEPALALRGGVDGLEVFMRFLAALPGHVAPGGYVLCETGGGQQSKTLERELKEYGFYVTIKKDLSNKARVVVGSWTNLS